MGNKKTKKRKKSATLVRQKSMMEGVAADFPFLSDENTVNHVRKSHVMFIMRGLPGSGKSTVVQAIMSRYKKAVICSADDYFMNAETRTYEFDVEKLEQAHDYCKTHAQEACEAKANVIIIDNTNVRRWEMKHYVILAAQYNYTVVCVTPHTPWAFDPAVLATKNKHGVTEEMLRKKVRAFEENYPSYWAWFLNQDASCRCLELGRRYLQICYELEPRFRQDLARHFGVEGLSLDRLQTLFSRPPRGGNLLHCTAYYAGGKSQDARDKRRDYASRDVVRRSMGQTFALHVIGFVITPRTIGARILLNYRQLLLWANDAEDRAASGGSLPLDEDIPGDVTPSGSVGSILEGRPRFRPCWGRGSRAHLTLRVAPGEAAVTAGEDLEEAGRREEGELGRGRHREVEGGAVRYYGDGICVVYLDTPIRVSTLFTGKY